MISQPLSPYKPLARFVLCLALARPALAAPPPPQLGPWPLDDAALRAHLEVARVMEHARAGRPPPRAALKQSALLKGVLSRAAQLELAMALGLAWDLWPAPLEEARRLARAVGAAEVLPYEQLVFEVEARYGAPFSLARHALLAPWRLDAVSEALAARRPEAQARAAFFHRHTQIRLDLALVGRVPSGAEIDRLIRAEPAALEAYYRAHPALFSRPPRVAVARASFADKAAAEAAYAEVQAGATVAEAAQRQGGRHRRRVYAEDQDPARYALADGALTPLTQEGGWRFERIEAHIPAVSRRLSDMRVRREIAAALLRERDTLPHARAEIEAARQALLAGEEASLTPRPGGLRLVETPAFVQGRLVPELGLAPALNDAAFALPVGGVTEVLTIRQSYVVARVKARQAPTEADWRAAAPGFIEGWRAEIKRGALEALAAELGGREVVLGPLKATVSAWISDGEGAQ